MATAFLRLDAKTVYVCAIIVDWEIRRQVYAVAAFFLVRVIERHHAASPSRFGGSG